MQVQYDKYFDERGQITVFLSLLFLVLMMSFLFIVEGVISYSASSLGEDAVKGAGESIMANYDRELFKNYHLFFLDAVSQTAKICAKQQMFSLIPEEDDQKSNQVKEDNGIHKSDRTNGRQSIRNASSVFFDIYDAKSLCDSLVEGGRKGISVQSAFSSEEEVQVKAIYTLKLSVPFFRPIRFQKDTAVKRRVFSGYVKHRRDYDAAGDNSIVYVAENGVVYHKNASCSHICLKITGNAAIQDIVHSSKYAACEKCIHKGSSLSAIFVTAYGDCYHSTLGCSGLKRTIKAVRLKDVGRLRPCSRCASGR